MGTVVPGQRRKVTSHGGLSHRKQVSQGSVLVEILDGFYQGTGPRGQNRQEGGLLAGLLEAALSADALTLTVSAFDIAWVHAHLMASNEKERTFPPIQCHQSSP